MRKPVESVTCPSCKEVAPKFKAGTCVPCYRHSYYLKHRQLERTRARSWALANPGHKQRRAKDFFGRISTTYGHMLARTQNPRRPYYFGKPVLERGAFIAFSINDPTYQTLFHDWQASGFSLKWTPSVDRIDPTKGYIFGNIRWVSYSENSRLGAVSTNHLVAGRTR